MEQFFIRDGKLFAVFVFCSAVLHFMFLGSIGILIDNERFSPHEQIKIKIATKQTVPNDDIKKEMDPAPPKEVTPPKPIKKSETRIPDKKPVAEPKKIQGLSEASIDEEGSITVPLGNTLMEEDKGQRLTPDEIASLKRDLSSDAILIKESFSKPDYTQAALDANLEGIFIVDVYVDATGVVRECELRKKIGYGMDERVLFAAKASRFVAKKNEKGISMGSWTEIRVYLEIP